MDMKKLREKAIKKTKQDAKELMSRDKIIVNAVKSMDVSDKACNLMFEQAREWFSVYYPELREKDIDDYIEKALAQERPAGSMGADFKEEDLNVLRNYLANIQKLRKDRKEMEGYLESVMKEEAPNITAVLGPVVGARMLSTAGGLKRLAEFPSSTVQVIGAEKALFSHLKKGTRPPKYGTLFQMPEIRNADKKKRGKAARKVAAKVSLAAKMDHFHGEFIGESLKAKLDEELSKL
jgi:nucleolar protein 56